MIKGLAITTVWVLDQDRAKEFYTEKLGMEVRTDLRMGGEDGMRWLTVGAKDQPEVELTLMVPGPPGMDPEAGESLKQLVSKGLMGAGVLRTDDVKADYAALKAKGVEFLQEPQERPYGTEAIFRDDSGNWFSLTQPSEQLDLSKGWGDCVE
ncbi:MULTISPECIES: VOC family protein [Streptomyces]|uniref:VOC family protein n=2 Tax=Streptomyces rimosus subsp. rimosus TaxID=132474 RepID=L8EPN9_STRR1|nr:MULTISPECIES: VOC family protein [Streptomyces]KOG69856.1 glyoxalase [Kitasatospora aureofaciens]MYT44074.1 VOC family protein [Streptomyces sp. SID5471]KEF06158.1 glyoxalase [Streptomyces rimosus]KEF17810.1 glyoxalase [Streptomyces rimosus]KOT30193.1 glyoxalase [Streptomyces rimosus subsp. rimosus]